AIPTLSLHDALPIFYTRAIDQSHEIMQSRNVRGTLLQNPERIRLHLFCKMLSEVEHQHRSLRHLWSLPGCQPSNHRKEEEYYQKKEYHQRQKRGKEGLKKTTHDKPG